MKIIAFGASSSKQSINKIFATFAAHQFEASKIEVLDLNDYPLPLYSVDIEKETGIPENAKRFCDELQTADFIIISFAEHNGTYTAVFKNLFDWMSRYQLKMFDTKKLFLLSTASGPRGGLSALEAALKRFPIHGAEIVGHFALGKFQENFKASEGIVNDTMKTEFEKVVAEISSKLFHEQSIS
jgi:chromate reductase, NAD(P)H dehydrogenase (quinone)